MKFNFFKKKPKEPVKEPPKDFHPGRPNLWQLLRANNILKNRPIAKQ